jgi:hypothetical protein
MSLFMTDPIHRCRNIERNRYTQQFPTRQGYADWATLVLAWLMAFAIGIAIYFFCQQRGYWIA